MEESLRYVKLTGIEAPYFRHLLGTEATAEITTQYLHECGIVIVASELKYLHTCKRVIVTWKEKSTSKMYVLTVTLELDTYTV